MGWRAPFTQPLRSREFPYVRPAVIPLADHWDLFRQSQKPPERWLERIAQINVGHLQKIARSPSSFALTVEPRPVDWNPAHAEIPANSRQQDLARTHPPPAHPNPARA